MIRDITSSSRSSLAVSLAFFAMAGVANTSIDTTVRSAAAAALAVGGVYELARYARRVDRERLARLSVALWAAFLLVTGGHAVGLESVGGIGPLSAAAVGAAGHGLTWAALLGAGTATAFLGFREYGARETDRPEEHVLDSDFDL